MFTQEETDNRADYMSIKGIEFLVKNLQTKRTPCPDNFTGKY